MTTTIESIARSLPIIGAVGTVSDVETREVRSARKQRAPRVDGSLRIRVEEDNPKRGKAALRYDLYRNGMTVDAYCRAAADLQGGKPYQYLMDIRWDAERGHIELYEKK